MHLVLCPDAVYAEHAAVVLASVFTHVSEPRRLKVWIVANGLDARSRGLLARVVGQGGGEIGFLEVETARLKDAPCGGHISPATYYRVLVLRHLPAEVDRVLYLDSDLVVETDVAPLFATDLAGHVLAAVANPCSRHARLGLPSGTPYFNAGVLVIDRRRWEDDHVTERVLAVISEKPEALQYYDQDALNCVLAGRWTRVAPEWNQQHYFPRYSPEELGYGPDQWKRAMERPGIVHFTGGSKPWHAKNRHPFRSRYHHYRRRAGLPSLWWRPAHLAEALRRTFMLSK